ncbi:hypothetical protein [Undibacterium umbellatum]|uniref:Uncharacterized protein n=1 Tax=Undibacterium umbellatum TaxID=2762300 RepID=A0ABR6ZHN7_9BURK|nr:hypothetical protein [Undibacterium umbellatum]MBC3911240.1 hypothetical protein [Undibacterium umbellatum]
MSLNAHLYIAETFSYANLRGFILERGGWEVQSNSKEAVQFFLPFTEGHAHVFMDLIYKEEIWDDSDIVYLQKIQEKLGTEPKASIFFDFGNETCPQSYCELAYDFCRKWHAIFENPAEQLFSCEQLKEKLKLVDV